MKKVVLSLVFMGMALGVMAQSPVIGISGDAKIFSIEPASGFAYRYPAREVNLEQLDGEGYVS